MIQTIIIGIVATTPEEKKVPNYVIPRSNFSTGTPDGAFLIGVPCKVVSKPYIIREKDIITGERDREVYDVISMVTGIKYTIPTGWADEYDTLEEANEHSHISGRYGGKMSDLIGRKYWPRDNSYILDFEGKGKSLVRKECEIVSVPFKEKTYDEYFTKFTKTRDQERTFILVKYEDRVYRVLFEEWALVDPE